MSTGAPMPPPHEEQVEQRLVSLLTDLVAIPTVYPPGDSTRMAAYLARVLGDAGYEVAVHARVPGMDNVVARLGSGRPSLVFNAHIDTVDAGDESQWRHPPLEARVESGVLSGLGAVNCKGSAAVQLWLAEEIARRGGPERGEVVFTFVTDEESLGPNGMAHLRDSGAVRPDMLLVGAPTENTPFIAERGVLWVEITTTGRPAHAGEPDAGDNAVSRMLRVCGAVEAGMAWRLPARVEGDMRSTINLGRIAGGVNTNVVPSTCLAQIDRRLLPGEHAGDAFAELCELVDAAGEPEGTVRVECLRATDGFKGTADGPLAFELAGAIQARIGRAAAFSSPIGVSDGRYFAGDGVEIVGFGPGVGSQGHAANESVEVAALLDGAMILRHTVERLLGWAAGP
jgi:acetylornithine deacetylase/succinyl-diaminopimelate desuccinylase-like protein